jgi:hypothetical protein
MPKLILATAATFLLRRPSAARADADGHTVVHSPMHARTRSRDATRRLRTSGAHAPYVDLGPLGPDQQA